MAAIAPLPEQVSMLTKSEPVVQSTEVQPDSAGEAETSEQSDHDGEVSAYRRKPKKPTLPYDPPVSIPKPVDPIISIDPIVSIPKPVEPVDPHPSHPIFIPSGTTLKNVETHVLCSDWFVQNVRELISEYKTMMNDNIRQAEEIANLRRTVGSLTFRIENITRERDQALQDYYNERIEHEKTRVQLNLVTKQLAELRRNYDRVYADLKKTKSELNQAIREIDQLNVDIANMTDRIVDLEKRLKISNESEDAANDRITELQRCIYELERAKASLERVKDREELKARDAQATIIELERRSRQLEETIRKLRKQLSDGVTIGYPVPGTTVGYPVPSTTVGYPVSDEPVYHISGDETAHAEPTCETEEAEAPAVEAAREEKSEESTPANEE